MWVQDCYNKGIPVDTIMIQGKGSHYMTTSRKRKVRDLNLENLMSALDGLIILERGWTLKISR